MDATAWSQGSKAASRPPLSPRQCGSCDDCAVLQDCVPGSQSDALLEALDHWVIHRPALEAGRYLMHAGDPAVALYMIRAGSFKTVRLLRSGEEHVMGVHIAGDLLGIEGLGSGRYQLDALALERGSVCAIPTSQVDQIAREAPAFTSRLMRLVGCALEEHQSHQLMTDPHSADMRLARFLLSYADRRSNRGLEPDRFELPLSRGDLANHLGLEIATVSRCIGRLRDRGLVAVDQRLVELLDVAALQLEAGFDATPAAVSLR